MGTRPCCLTTLSSAQPIIVSSECGGILTPRPSSLHPSLKSKVPFRVIFTASFSCGFCFAETVGMRTPRPENFAFHSSPCCRARIAFSASALPAFASFSSHVRHDRFGLSWKILWRSRVYLARIACLFLFASLCCIAYRMRLRTCPLTTCFVIARFRSESKEESSPSLRCWSSTSCSFRRRSCCSRHAV